jgi:riboflavin biosynthesis pyrimidine reductase
LRILRPVSAALHPLAPVAETRSAADVVAGLGLDGGAAAVDGRPRVAAAMIASADGRAAVQGSSAGLGHPADTALLRELRTAVDAILVGTGTLRAERYAQLLDDDQRERRVARGLDAEPIVATIARSGNVPLEVPLFAEPDARIAVYTEAEAAAVDGCAARVTVERRPPGEATPHGVLGHLAAEAGVRSVLCEGGPTLLRALAAARCIDHLFLTLAPVLAGGDAPTLLVGPPLDPPGRLELRDVYRAGGHVFMHYAETR